MRIKIRIDWGKMFILQIFLFLLIINSVTAGNESVRGDVFYNIERFGVKIIGLQAPEVYINQSFWARVTIRVNQSYSAGVFNATIELPSSFSLPYNDYNHSNPEIVDGYGAEYLTNWTVNATVSSAGNYTLNVSVGFFNSKKNATVEVNPLPPDFDNGSAIVDAGGPYNFSDTVTINVTVRDVNANYVNIMGLCNYTILYPNSTVFLENGTSEYRTGSHGQYYYNFTVPNVTGNYTVNVNCTLPVTSNISIFEVTQPNQPPYFYIIFLTTGSYIHRDKNSPTPTELVNFWIYVNDSDNDPLNVTFYYRTATVWLNKSMVYDSVDNVWKASIGPYSVKTIVNYYVSATDNINPPIRTPETLYDSLVWDYPPTVPPGVPAGGVIEMPPEKRGEITIIDYPETITIEQGGIEFEMVKIKNTGNATLHNVKISIEGIELSWYSIEPDVTDIGVGETQTFIIKFIVPEDAVVKEYIINLVISSDEVTEKVKGTFEVTEKPPEILMRIVDIVVSELEPNRKGRIDVVVENKDIVSKNMTFTLLIPADWLVDKREITKTIPAQGQERFQFNIMPTEDGTYTLRLTGKYNGKELSETVYVNIKAIPRPPLWGYFDYIFIAVIAVLACMVILIYRKKRKRKTQKEKIREFRSYVLYGKRPKVKERIKILRRRKRK